MRSQLAKGQIAAEDGQARFAERTRQRHEKRRLAVRSCAVREYKATSTWAGRAVQKSSHGYCIQRSVQEHFVFIHTQRIVRLRFIGQQASVHARRFTVEYILVVSLSHSTMHCLSAPSTLLIPDWRVQIRMPAYGRLGTLLN